MSGLSLSITTPTQICVATWSNRMFLDLGASRTEHGGRAGPPGGGYLSCFQVWGCFSASAINCCLHCISPDCRSAASFPPPSVLDPAAPRRSWWPVPGTVWVYSRLAVVGGELGGREDHAQGQPRQRAPHHTQVSPVGSTPCEFSPSLICTPGARPCGSSESPQFISFTRPFGG